VICETDHIVEGRPPRLDVFGFDPGPVSKIGEVSAVFWPIDKLRAES